MLFTIFVFPSLLANIYIVHEIRMQVADTSVMYIATDYP